MHTKDLPKATSINQDKGMLLYCDDGMTLKQISVKLFDGGGHTTVYSNLFTNDFDYEYLNEQTEMCEVLTMVSYVNSIIPYTPQI